MRERAQRKKRVERERENWHERQRQRDIAEKGHIPDDALAFSITGSKRETLCLLTQLNT